MLETARYEVDRRRRGTVVLTAGISLVAVFFIALYPSFQTADIDIDQMIEAWPPAMREAFGLVTLASIEGFLAVELYNFVWVIVLGLYFAYLAAGLIADDIEGDRMDLLCSLPVSRTRVLFEKFAALVVPILAVNVVVGSLVYAGTIAIGEPIDALGLVMVHLLSIPYLLLCATIGLVFSVKFDRGDVAKRAAIAAIFALYLLDSIAGSVEEISVVQSLTPSGYYDPTAILVQETYAIGDAGVLLVATAVVLVGARVLFVRRDL